MNSNVIEIVTILVQKLLHNEDVVANEEEIIQSLLDLGYSLRDIEIAFELIFSSAEIIGLSDGFENHTYLPTSERVLSAREKFILSDDAQRILLGLLKTGYLTIGEMEEMIKRAYTLQAIEIGTKELWSLLKSTLKDKMRIAMIKNKVSEFQAIKDDQNYWIH